MDCFPAPERKLEHHLGKGWTPGPRNEALLPLMEEDSQTY